MIRWGSVILGCGIALQAFTTLADVRPTEAEDVMSPGYAGVTGEQLPAPTSEGARLYRQYCGQCHHMVAPAKYDDGHWRKTLERMRLRFKGLGQTLPSDQEWKAIQDYLFQHAAK